MSENREDITQVAVIQPTIAEAVYDEENKVYHLIVENLPIIALMDNDLLDNIVYRIVNFGGKFETEKMVQIWCPPAVLTDSIVKPTNVHIFNPGNPQQAGPKKIAVANRDVWFTACSHLVQGIVFLIQNGLPVEKTIGLLPMCMQITVKLSAPLDNFMAFFDAKANHPSDVWVDTKVFTEFLLRMDRERVREQQP